MESPMPGHGAGGWNGGFLLQWRSLCGCSTELPALGWVNASVNHCASRLGEAGQFFPLDFSHLGRISC